MKPTAKQWLRAFNLPIFYWTDGLVRICTALFWLLLLALGIFFWFQGERFWWIIYVPGFVMFFGQSSVLNPAYRHTIPKYQQYLLDFILAGIAQNQNVGGAGDIYVPTRNKVRGYWQKKKWLADYFWFREKNTIRIQICLGVLALLSLANVWHLIPWVLDQDKKMNPKLWQMSFSLFIFCMAIMFYWGRSWKKVEQYKPKRNQSIDDDFL